MSKQLLVKDMYKYASTNNLKLLSNYSSTFWSEYLTNSAKYDKLFNRLYMSFKYFNQDETSVIATLTTDFIDEVYNHLLVNDKKYSELYRVNVLTDNDYKILDNYKYTEVMDKDLQNYSSITSGSRSDSTSNTKGAQTDTTETQVSAYNSSSYSNQDKTTDIMGSRSDSGSFTKGSQTDSITGSNAENYTLTKTGKTSDYTMSEMISKHSKYWSNYEFYTYIFEDICKELLLS